MTAAWTLALLAAVLWPGRVLGLVDGIPLNGRTEAILIGVALPALWWLDRPFLRRPLVRGAIVGVLMLKAAAWILLPQHGLCARFSTTAPFRGISNVIPIDEPAGFLRSWDVRADWGADAPRCTAILDRAYESEAEFPAWFLNLLDAIRPGRRDLSLEVTGYVAVDEPGRFELETGPDMTLGGKIGSTGVSPRPGAAAVVTLAPGAHPIELRATITGSRWRLVPRWNGADAWRAARFTATAPSTLDRIAARPIAAMISGIVVLLLGAWSWSAIRSLELSTAMAAWTVCAAALLAWMGAHGALARAAGPLLLGSVFIPVAMRRRNMRAAFALVGIPWLALFVGHSLAQIGRFTAYTIDDWHIYQSAAYRIYLNGYWLEGGSATFYYQAFYRWVAGAIHVIFGDSSVGELYWDAGWLLTTALLCFAIVKRFAGFRWAIAAASVTLATFTVGTIWYIVGRGLSEITAAGWMSIAAFSLFHARLGRTSAALTAGIFAVLMFYTRLNHLLFTAFLLALLIPIRVPAAWSDAWRAIARVHLRPVAVYIATVAAGVALFAARTWWFTGRFSILYGTSFGVQENGLRLATVGSPAMWSQVAKSVGALVWMREPPAPDPRATVVVLGLALSVLALIQVPHVNRLPLAIALLTVGAIAGAVVAHSHEYPGRMAIHLMPFAVAMAACGASRLVASFGSRVSREASVACS